MFKPAYTTYSPQNRDSGIISYKQSVGEYRQDTDFIGQLHFHIHKKQNPKTLLSYLCKFLAYLAMPNPSYS